MTARATLAARSGFRNPVLVSVAALVASLAAMSIEAAPAAAQGFPGFFDEAPRYKPRVKRRQPARQRPAATETAAVPPAKNADAAKIEKPAEPAKPKGPLFAVISIGDQQVTIYNHDGVVAKSRVSTGKAGHPTPKGVFTIIGRSRHHYSNIYGGAPMPFMQRVTWSGVAMHLGVVPGYPASHGCIRLPAGFAAHLWGLTKVGERVFIARHDVKPAAITHAALPVPKMQPAEPGMETGATNAPQQVAEARTSAGDSGADAAGVPKFLNPMQYAEIAKARSAAEATATAKAAQALLASAAAKKAEATKAAARLKLAETAHDAAESKAAAAAAAVSGATSASADRREALEIVSLNAQSTALSAMVTLAAAREDVSNTDVAWSEEVRRWREATAAADAARQAQRAATKRTSPVSVLVSKKDGKVYVRQGLAPLFDAPASVKSPEKPLGTHLYVASAAGDDGQSLKWTALTMPAQSAADSERLRKTKPGQKSAAEPSPQQAFAASSAEEALDRIEIPEDARTRISELLWTGGSLIISDQPLSSETSDVGTDLVVTVR